MEGRDDAAGSNGCGGEETGTDAGVDSVEMARCGCEFEALQPSSHAIIKTEEKIYFKSGFTNTTLTHVL
jgi:hypothetical protein